MKSKMNSIGSLKWILLAISLSLLVGCVTTPRETVQLSLLIGEQLDNVEKQHIEIVNSYFDRIVQDIDELYDEKIEIYKGNFATSLDDTAKIEDIITVAVEEIDGIHKQKSTFIAGIEKQRKVYLNQVISNYEIMRRSNTTLTTFLESAYNVQNSRDEIVQNLGLETVNSNIQMLISTINETSITSDEFTREIEKIFGGIE